MKKITIFTQLLLLLVLSQSCKIETEKKCFFEHFKLKDVLIIDRTNRTYFSSEIIHNDKITGDTLITFYQMNDNLIVFLGYGQNTRNDTLHLNSFLETYDIDRFLDYYYVNSDTIFISTNYMTEDRSRLDYAIFLLDIKGNVYKKWDIAELTGIDHVFFNVSSEYFGPNRTIYNKEKQLLFLKTDIIFPPYEAFDVNEVPTELVLNIATDEAYFIYAKPDIYGKGDFYGNHALNHSKAFINDSTLVLSFPIDHYLYKYSITGELLKKKECKSLYIDKMVAFERGEPVTFNNLVEAQTCYPYYYQIVYDTKNRYLYRIVHHEQNVLNEVGEKNTEHDRNLSIMVIDENLNIIGEYFIPPYHIIPYLPRINNQEYLHLQIKGNRNYIIRGIYEYMN